MRFIPYFLLFSLLSISCFSQVVDTLSISQQRGVIIKRLASLELPQEDRISSLYELGESYYGESQDSSFYYLNSALNLSQLKNDTLNIIKTYLKLALAKVYIEEYDTSLQYIDSSLVFSNKKKPEHYESIGLSYSLEGIVYNNIEQMDVAFEKILQANQYLSKAPPTKQTSEALVENYGDLALIYFNIEEYTNAINSSEKALRRSKADTIDYRVAENYSMLGTIYYELANYDSAKKYLDSATTVFSRIEDDEGLLEVSSNRGKLYNKLEKYQMAKDAFESALILSSKLDDNYGVTAAHLDLSHTYVNTNEILKARTHLEAASVISETVGLATYSGEIAMLEAEILEKEINIPVAITVLKNSIHFLESQNLQESKSEVYKALYELYKKNNDSKNSMAYFEKYIHVKDSLRDQLQNGKLNVLRVEHNYNQLASELENTETELKLANEEQKRISNRNTFLLIGAFLVLFFSVFQFFRQKKLNLARKNALKSSEEVLELKREALDKEMRFKNKQITDFAIHISEKNELLEKIKSKLKKIRVTNNTYKEMVNDTLHFINNDIEQNKEKIQLYQHIDETTDSFGAKINQLYPHLSEKEKKVAIMLRLGQTSKQIGLQLNISAASVDNYRYSLRKKMEIPKGKALKGFIQNL